MSLTNLRWGTVLRLILESDGIKNVNARWREMKNIISVMYYNSFWKGHRLSR